MTEQFKKGDKVTWQSHGSTAEGTVQKKITSDTEPLKVIDDDLGFAGSS